MSAYDAGVVALVAVSGWNIFVTMVTLICASPRLMFFQSGNFWFDHKGFLKVWLPGIPAVWCAVFFGLWLS